MDSLFPGALNDVSEFLVSIIKMLKVNCFFSYMN